MSQAPQSKLSQDAQEQERQHFRKIIAAFRFYRTHQLKRVQESIQHYKNLPEHHRKLIPAFPKHLHNVRTCLEHNYEIIKLIIDDAEDIFDADCSPASLPTGDTQELQVTSNDMDKVQSTLKQFVRDWSTVGAEERAVCYQPVVNDICKFFPPGSCDPSEVKVLVPGAGLGRLAWEIALKGFTCQGNEWSLFMLFTSYFVINKCTEIDSFTLYPWVHQFCNNWSWSDQLSPIRFPDVRPNLISEQSNFSMAAGDFLEVYTDPECWDCVATVYFIDTAHNIVAYIESIWKILKPNGYWLNLGPLLYHYADIPGEMSIELDYDHLRELIIKIGFEFVHETRGVKSCYTQNPKSMLNYQYNCVYFVVRKPAVTSDSANSD